MISQDFTNSLTLDLSQCSLCIYLIRYFWQKISEPAKQQKITNLLRIVEEHHNNVYLTNQKIPDNDRGYRGSHSVAITLMVCLQRQAPRQRPITMACVEFCAGVPATQRQMKICSGFCAHLSVSVSVSVSVLGNHNLEQDIRVLRSTPNQ